MSSNYNDNSGIQGANFKDTTVKGDVNINIGHPEQKTPSSEIFPQYKQWVREEKEHSIVRKKLKQLVIDGKQFQIKRKLKGN